MAKIHSTMENGKGNIVSSVSEISGKVMTETWDVTCSITLTPEGQYTFLVIDRKTGMTLKQIDGSYTADEALTVRNKNIGEAKAARIHKKEGTVIRPDGEAYQDPNAHVSPKKRAKKQFVKPDALDGTDGVIMALASLEGE